jgi:hypothetical protein
MKAAPLGAMVLKVELLQGVLALGLFGFLAPWGLLELRPLVLGTLFAGINFLLLVYGVQWVLTSLGGKGKIRAGIVLLVLKLALFLGLLSLLLFRFKLEPLSFMAGVTCLLIAITLERLWSCLGA